MPLRLICHHQAPTGALPPPLNYPLLMASMQPIKKVESETTKSYKAVAFNVAHRTQ